MKALLMLGSVLALTACAVPDVSHYAKETPKLDVTQYFQGKTEAWGIFQKRSGEVVKRFHIKMEGHSQGDKFILKEHFFYTDGTDQERVWTFTRQTDGSLHGSAGDVLGVAIGKGAGDAFRMNYTLKLPVGKSVYNVKFDDWLFRIDEQTVVNRATVTKFGFEVGQVTVFFRHE
ncbi:MAG: DUF3833 domain-containing protein [Candidimonas sp.]|nr:MAG: DUF3833 domain-containing protein [Candidimonas sp.]TAM19953.1 MAG: DUF3833 domain-containing protein [Candidimonas sp.]TAM76433.1 MAG: DUF3833 domain-containing protein [Candidimonas sp.]